jgi:multidrug efflux pump subunit AcrA (membrane-fusion protein)
LQKRKLNKNLGFIILTSSILVTFLLINFKPVAIADSKDKQLPFVESKRLIASTHQSIIRSQGFISSEVNLNLVSELQSQVQWVSEKLKKGMSFSKNDTLLILNIKDFELALVSAETKYLNAKINLDREKAEFEIASNEWKRIGSGEATELALRKPQLEQAILNFSIAEATLNKAKRDLSKTIFIAPFNGRVVNKYIENKSIVFPGTLIANIYSTEFFEVNLPISDRDIFFTGLTFDGKEINENNQLKVKLIASNKELFGLIVRTEAELDPKSKMKSCIARIDNKYSKLILSKGEYVEADIYGLDILNSYKIPRNKVRNKKVWIINDKSLLKQREVEIIRFEEENVITRNGFKPRDHLLISRMTSPIDNLEVNMEVLY